MNELQKDKCKSTFRTTIKTFKAVVGMFYIRKTLTQVDLVDFAPKLVWTWLRAIERASHAIYK